MQRSYKFQIRVFVSVPVSKINEPSMDAPLNASFSLNGSEHAVRCCRLSGLIDGGTSDAAGPVWSYADRIHIAYASFKLSVRVLVLPTPSR